MTHLGLGEIDLKYDCRDSKHKYLVRNPLVGLHNYRTRDTTILQAASLEIGYRGELALVFTGDCGIQVRSHHS